MLYSSLFTHPIITLVFFISSALATMFSSDTLMLLDVVLISLLIDSPLKGCSARLVSSIIDGDGRMLNLLRGPNILKNYRVILPTSP